MKSLSEVWGWIMDVKKREEMYKELDNLLLKIKNSDEQQKKILDTLFLKKFDVLCREFDLWISEEMKKLDKRIEECVNKKRKEMV